MTTKTIYGTPVEIINIDYNAGFAVCEVIAEQRKAHILLDDLVSLPERTEPEVEAKSELFNFQQEVGEWGDATFNPKRGNNQDPIVHHLKKEVDELLASHSPEEAADCFILLLHHAYKGGYDLLAEANKKMVINRKRKWGNPDKNGVVEHV